MKKVQLNARNLELSKVKISSLSSIKGGGEFIDGGSEDPDQFLSIFGCTNGNTRRCVSLGGTCTTGCGNFKEFNNVAVEVAVDRVFVD